MTIYHRVLTFAVILLAVGVTVAQAGPPLALAERYQNSVNIKQYLVSEKLDGVRGYWDGSQLLTRQGNPINAPIWFTHNWPDRKLDGELWIARGQFDQVSAIVRRLQSDANDWRRIKFMVFDLHPQAGHPDSPFTTRLQELTQLINASGNPHLALIEQFDVSDDKALLSLLTQRVGLGAEGLMLHKRDAAYRIGRSDDILKLKPYWDAEARVIAHLPGKGKYLGKMGALLVEATSDTNIVGRRFRIGTGFSDRDRAFPPPVGTIITYQFHGYTSKGLPRFSSYLRVREPE